MDSGIKNWIEHFGISETQVTQWITTSGEANPLRWCLMNQKVPEPAYLNWAAEAYELPVVTEDFFQIQPDDRFWSTVSSMHFWTPGLFPLAEWEGTLMIACVEPPTNFRIDRPHRFVLASAQNLFHHWSRLNPKSATTVTAAPVLPQRPVAETKAPKRQAPTESDDPVENSFIRAFSSFTGGETPAVEAPAGLNFSADSTEELSDGPDGLTQAIVPLNLKLNSTPDGLTADVDAALSARLDLPDGVDSNSFAPADDQDDSVVAMDFDSPASIPVYEDQNAERHDDQYADHHVEQTVDQHEVGHEHLHDDQQEVEFASQPIEEAQILSQHMDEPALQDLNATATANIRPAAASTRHRAPEMTAIGLIDLETIVPKPIIECINLDELAVQALAELAKSFDSSLIFQYVNGIPTPWRWFGFATKGKGPLGYSLDLVPPSMFRIVHTTQLPYSGRIASSPVHDHFFSIFMSETSPVHSTIVPIMSGNTIVAMLMGMNSTPLPPLESLERVESVSKVFSKTWAHIHDVKAA